MDTADAIERSKLYNQLIEAYSNENLNRLTGKLILLYKTRNYVKIREIANKVSKYVAIDQEEDARCFSKLVVLYHPDKGESIRKQIEKHYLENDVINLVKYSHILVFQNSEYEKATKDEDIDYTPEYKWDGEQNGYGTYSDTNKTENEYYSEESERSFYNAIQLRMYGDLDKHFPSYYLEDFTEFELSDSGIESLDGVAFCIHAVIMDLSNNEITDISDLWNLSRLEELYLANNKIGYIDALSNLPRLKTVDLSGNQIDDILPLFQLDDLEYINLIGNPIPIAQIKRLKEKEIIVMF